MADATWEWLASKVSGPGRDFRYNISPLETTRSNPLRPVFAALLGALVAFVLVAPVWMVPHLPLVDYPNHLARAFILAHLDDPGFRQVYAADWRLNPYLLMDVVLVAMQWLLPVEVAGRVLLSISLLAMPLAAWFFLRQANPGQDHLALWSLLLCYNHFFLVGLINLQLGMALCFLALGLWLRYLERPRLSTWLALLVAATLTYFTHLMGYGIALFIFLWMSWRTRRPLHAWLNAGLAFLPGLVVFAWPALHSTGAMRLEFQSLSDKVLIPLILGYSFGLNQVTLLVMVACVVAAHWRNAEFRWNHRWLEVTLLLFAFYWLLPGRYERATFVDFRVVPFYCITALAAGNIGRRAKWLAPVALLLFAAQLSDVALTFAGRQPELGAYARGIAATEPGVRVLPLVESRRDGRIQRSYAHFWAYGVIRKRWLVPYLFHDPGVHPLVLRYPGYRPEPDGYMPLIYDRPPDWEAIRRDYDYVWAVNVGRFAPQLATLGPLVYSEGDFQLYKVRRLGAAAENPSPSAR